MGCSASCRCTYFPIAPRSVRAAAMRGLSLWCGRRWAPSRRAARLWDHARLGLPLNALAQSYCPAAPPTIAVIGASRAYRPAVAYPAETGQRPRVVAVVDTAAVTGRSMAVALHGTRRLSTLANGVDCGSGSDGSLPQWGQDSQGRIRSDESSIAQSNPLGKPSGCVHCVSQ